MRTLAIDLGTKRVGLALSDQGGRFATPLEVLQVSSPDHALDVIRPLMKQEGVERILVGLPLNMDGTIGPTAQATIQWARQIEGIAVIFVAERLSSFEAEQTLTERKRAGEKLTRKRKKEQLDAVVAAQLLQAFLDGKLAPFLMTNDQTRMTNE